MARFTFTLIAVILAIFVVLDVSGQQQQLCTQSSQCSTRYCRDGWCINFGDDPNDVGVNPCNTVRCTRDRICVLKQVQCYAFPCPPIHECVPTQTVCNINFYY